MPLINTVSLYSSINQAEKVLNVIEQETHKIETVGDPHSAICCFIATDSPILDSKDYKTLAKIFEKLMLKIEKLFVVNVISSPNTDFVLYTNEFKFKKIYIFGDQAKMKNIPVRLTKNEITATDNINLLLLDSLHDLVETKDIAKKELSWKKIKEFHNKQ